jgi:hypothetical protein
LSTVAAFHTWLWQFIQRFVGGMPALGDVFAV